MVAHKHPVTGAQMTATEEELLEHIHNMRVDTFEQRTKDPLNEKPYLPMLSSDEKEVIMEQYFASKKKMNK